MDILGGIVWAPMEKKCGSTRMAYVGNNWTIKRPLLHGKAMLNGSLAPMSNAWNGRWKLAKKFFTKGADEEESLLWCLGQEGWLENHRERQSWKQLGDLVFPTRALMGNVLVYQITTSDITFSVTEMWELIRATSLNVHTILASEAVAHILYTSENYGICANDKKIRLRDYGGEGASTFLLANRNGVLELFQKISEAL